MVLELRDPASWQPLFFKKAELEQMCKFCGNPMLGRWIVASSGSNWICVEHLERLLITLPPTAERAAQLFARHQLRDSVPGDVVTITRQLLAAVST